MGTEPDRSCCRPWYFGQCAQQSRTFTAGMDAQQDSMLQCYLTHKQAHSGGLSSCSICSLLQDQSLLMSFSCCSTDQLALACGKPSCILYNLLCSPRQYASRLKCTTKLQMHDPHHAFFKRGHILNALGCGCRFGVMFLNIIAKVWQ